MYVNYLTSSASIDESRSFERHLTVDQLAELWGMSDDFVRRRFLHEPGVVVFHHHRLSVLALPSGTPTGPRAVLLFPPG